MCDVCSNLLTLLYSRGDLADTPGQTPHRADTPGYTPGQTPPPGQTHQTATAADDDERLQEGDGLKLTKSEVLTIILYTQTWQQRQCMCCYKDFKNFERLNNIVQVAMNLAIKFIHTLPQDCETASAQNKGKIAQSKDPRCKEEKGKNHETITKKENDKEKNKCNEEENKDKQLDLIQGQIDRNTEQKEINDEEKSGELTIPEAENLMEGKEKKSEEDAEEAVWTLEEKDQLFQFITKVFLINFPMYMAYKHNVHASLEELSQQEASALNCYCELSDPEVPVYLLRNVCFFCDRNGIHAISTCFDKATPDVLPYTVAHTLINIIANLRLWMNINTVMSYIVPLRSQVIRYMCRLSDEDLRMAGTRNMMDLMWAAVKEPIETHISFDREGLNLAFKYFTCSTLTIRLTGITQINNQINLYNEIANTNEALMEADSMGGQLGNWLIENKIIEHIFGPNLHVEIIKQSQMILNFLAVEGKITNEHIDIIWAAAQLKHCSKQVHDILIPLIKNLEIEPAKHLLNLVSILEIGAHTEQTLYLASALIKFLWNTHTTHHRMGTVHHRAHRQHYHGSYHHREREEGEIDPALLRPHYNSESSEGIPSDGERVLGEVRTALPDSLIKEAGVSAPKTLNRKGGKIKRSKPKMIKGQRVRVDDASDNSSLGANSDLSNISDESLPSDMEEVEVDDEDEDMEEEGASTVKHKHHSHGHHHHAHHHPSAHRHHHHRHHKGDGDHDMSDSEIEEGYSESSEEEEEEDEEEEMIPLEDGIDEDEFAEIQKEMMANRKREGTVHDHGDCDGKHKGHTGYRAGVHHRIDEELDSDELHKHMHMIHAHEGSSELGDEDEVVDVDDDEDDDEEEDEEILLRQMEERERQERERREFLRRKQQMQRRRQMQRQRNALHLRRLQAMRATQEEKTEKPEEREEGSKQQEKQSESLKETKNDKEEDNGSVEKQKEEDKIAVQKIEKVQTTNSMDKKSENVDTAVQQEGREHNGSQLTGKHSDCQKTPIIHGDVTSVEGTAGTSKRKDDEEEAAVEPELEASKIVAEDESSDSDYAEDQRMQLMAHMKAVRKHGAHVHGGMYFAEDMLSEEGENSCNSSQLSTKSEKNMADFEGEDVISDDELSRINAEAHAQHYTRRPSHMQQHLANMASAYHKQKTSKESNHTGGGDCGVAQSDSFRFEDVCKPGNTLLWDLLQDPVAHKLPDGLASEAEKVLFSLVCFATDKRIRTRFIEACVENIANHRSVVISLRLLPKLFGSFQSYRAGLDTHSYTMWAENELHMMKHFFNNLLFYTNGIKKGIKFPYSLYTSKEEIQVRLQFLTCVFTSMGSPDKFKLSLEQVDTLWNCLVDIPECSDDLLSWFLNQAKSKDHHAMSLETFKHIFMEKMPMLKPEDMSMIGLSLFTQLCGLARVANASLEKPLPDDQICGMDQLWGIALRAQNTDVSLNAIHYLNNHYISFGSGALEKEEEFVQRCMGSLVNASGHLLDNPESGLQVIQRGLILLTNHLESFRKRYAYHLRNWQQEGHGITSHQKSLQDKSSTPLRVVLQPAGASEKTTIEMLSSDLVAELRAEVARWWEQMQRQHQLRQQQQQQQLNQGEGQASSSAMLTPILGAMLGDGPIRMITQGQELTADVDEKTLAEMQFKDMQLVFVSLSANRGPRRHDGSTSPYLSAPPRDKMPMMLLLAKPHFSELFGLLQQLSAFDCSGQNIDSQEAYSLQMKARVLSRKVWELLMLLPTNTDMLDGFQTVSLKDGSQKTDWAELLDPHSPHKLMYSLQIVESLSRPPKHRRRSNVTSMRESQLHSSDSELSVEDPELPEEIWSRKFISCGGLEHLFNIFLSGVLQTRDGNQWNEWNQDCLAYLLRLMSQFAVTQSDLETGQDDVFDNYESPRKRAKKRGGQHEKVVIPMLNQAILSMIDVQPVLKILMSILYDAALPSTSDNNQWHSASWGRTEVVHYALSFLVSWAHSCDLVCDALCNAENYGAWLKRLTLEAPEPQVRISACRGLYRLCMGENSEGRSGYNFLLPTLAAMLVFLDDAQKMKTARRQSCDEKEPFGPGSRDYFWLVCRLVDNIKKDDAVKSWQEEGCAVGLDALMRKVAQYITNRPFHEKRHNTIEDDGLIGLLHLAAAVIKHEPPFKTSNEGKAFITDCFWLLFALPSPKQRYLPKCKSQASRSAVYDLLVELVKRNVENYDHLHKMVLKQHSKESHAPYTWDHWPHEEGRSNCGFVGLTNLGATCYMATCMQHLFMIPQARKSVLEARMEKEMKHEGTLMELKKMFAYLMESERKAYNPRSFCKVYTMDKQPLNTGEQKDMVEFFTDLISKLEEMGPELKRLVKSLFGGVQTNNVVSLDCPHVSRTKEEFYTVRCQVSDMKNLYESLDEVTVKDMLEGDNMYTCSKCQKKVRAEKRACFKCLPKILCFNTMRYTFNMVTMMKEKVNSHFSFPLRLDMSGYMESNLISSDKLPTDDDEREEEAKETAVEENAGYEYELIGVTVHTGTADGGHYYSFIRDRLNKNDMGQDKWYLFNDAEVKPFDPTQIAMECFGGEMTSKTYDSVTDKFMDFSFEKTNSAYMLFYERLSKERRDGEREGTFCEEESDEIPNVKVELTKDLADWIWEDNMQFLQDKNIFEHTYFGFMWQMCGYIPTTLPKDEPERVPLMAAKLSASFVLETLIHAKEKPTMLQWIELTTKQFNACPAACEWFLDTMAEDDWWPQQILIKCPNQVVRQMFQRLIIHVIQQLRNKHVNLYLHPMSDSDDEEADNSQIGSHSCITRFVKKMLSIIEGGSRPQSKYLSEYFAFLLEFAKMGEEEVFFLIHINAISTMVNYFLAAHRPHDNYVEILSDDEDEEDNDVIPLGASDDKYRPQSLEKMIHLIAYIVEKSRDDSNQLQISQKDYYSIIGGKSFPFLVNQIRYNINLRQTGNLLFSLCRWNDRLAMSIVTMIFNAISRLGSESGPFFKLLSMLVEFIAGPPGMPPFTQYILHKIWEVTDYCPQQCLEWLAQQVTRNKLAHTWVLQNMEMWVEMYLMAHHNIRVRNAAAMLLVALVPSNNFRQAYRTSRTFISPNKDAMQMTPETVSVLHEVYGHLLRLLPRARQYVDATAHGTMRLVAYFALMTYCLVSKTEKLMFSRHFPDLWGLFQPKLSEPAISMHHNKQALLMFWHQVCIDCPENIKQIVTNGHVMKNIAFNYILADHDDQEVVLFNRSMLPAYYGILRMCCQASRSFTRQLAMHQNIQWAFKNITPYPGQYTVAVDELFRMMKLMTQKPEGCSEEEAKAIAMFRRTTLQMYLASLDARSSWQTLIMALKNLMESMDDRLLVLCHGGLPMMYEAFNTLHMMYHEATACHVTGDLADLLSLILQVLKVARHILADRKNNSEIRQQLYSWKDRMDMVRKLLTLLNSYTPPDVRAHAIDVLKEMVLNFQSESLNTIIPILLHYHTAVQESTIPSYGPYFPRRGQKPVGHKANIRPPRPQFQMFLHHHSHLEIHKGIDEAYDQALHEYFYPYHSLVDLLVRVAVNQQNVTETVINLHAMVAYEGAALHMPFFAKLWYEIYQSEQVDKSYIEMLCNNSAFIDYVDAVLMDFRQSLSTPHINQFFCNFFPKIHQQVLHDGGQSLLDSLIASITAERSSLEAIRSEKDLVQCMERLTGDLRALLLVFSVQRPTQLSALLEDSLLHIQRVCARIQEQRKARQEAEAKQREEEDVENSDEESDDDEEEGDIKEVPRKRRRTDSKEEKLSPPKATKSESTGKEEKSPKCKDSKTENATEKLIEKNEAESTVKSDKTVEQSNSLDKKSENTVAPVQSEGASETKTNAKSETTSGKTTKPPRPTEDSAKPSSSGTNKTVTIPTPSKTGAKRPASTEPRKYKPGPLCSKVPRPSTSTGIVRPGSRTGSKAQPREKPFCVDVVAKHIEMIFGMVKKK